MAHHRLGNSQGKNLTLRNSDSLSVDKSVIYLDTVDELLVVDKTELEVGSVAHVSDSNRGGTFVLTATNDTDGGVNFNGWKRDYSGAVYIDWFISNGTDIYSPLTTALTISNNITCSPNSSYTISDTIIVSDNTGIASGICIDFKNSSIVPMPSMTGKFALKINGSSVNQKYMVIIKNCKYNMNGVSSSGLLDFNSGVLTSYVENIDIYDSTITGNSFGTGTGCIRVFNSFNITMKNIRTNHIDTPIKLEADNNISGFSNLTNIKIVDSVFQRGGKLIHIDVNVALDTLVIENTALKTGISIPTNDRYAIYIDGHANAVSLKTAHIEGTEVGIFVNNGLAVYMSIQDTLFTNTYNAFDWQGIGTLNLVNTRFIDNESLAEVGTFTKHNVFANMKADVFTDGYFLVNTSDYIKTIPTGGGKLVSSSIEYINSATVTVSTVDDKRTYINTGGSLSASLPLTEDAGDGFEVTFQQRGGAVTVTPNAVDRILGLTGTSAGTAIQSSVLGASITLRNQNIGGQKFWTVVSKSGVWYASNYAAGNPNYTASNYTETKALDASTATAADVADVLATLIKDLEHMGYIA